MPDRLLRLSQGSYETAIVRRNAINRVLSMDVGGFFDRVILAFFRADADAEWALSERHHVVDVAVARQGRRAPGALAEVAFLRRAIAAIRREAVTVIQANDPHISGLNALLLSRIARVPYVIEVVSDYDLSHRVGGPRAMPYLPGRRIERALERLVLRSAHAVYADRRHYLRYAIARGARPDRSFLVRCTTDSFYFSAQPQKEAAAYAAVPAGKRRLLYIGRLSPEKYVLDLIDCLAVVRHAGEDAILIVVGDGPQRAELEARAAARGVTGSVFLVGARTAQEIVDLSHDSDVILATHAGYSLVEAALSGRAIVAYAYEWHAEFIRDGENGLLVPYRDAEAMGRAAVRVLRDSALAQRLGGAAEQTARTAHDPSDAIGDERAIYERLLGRRTPSHV